MITLSPRTWVCNAAAVFTKGYGLVVRQARHTGYSRQALYQQACQLEARLQTPQAPTPPPAPEPKPQPTLGPAPVLTPEQRHCLAVTACAMGLSTRQVEDLLRVLEPEHGPDHAAIGRWVAAAAKRAGAVLQVLDQACQDRIETLAVDEIFFGGSRPWLVSSRPA